MTPERKAELEAATEYGRRMAEQTAALMRRRIDARDEAIELLRASQDALAGPTAECSPECRPRLVAVNGARVDQRSPWDFG